MKRVHDLSGGGKLYVTDHSVEPEVAEAIKEAILKAYREWEIDHDRGHAWVALDEIANLLDIEIPEKDEAK